jgi:hypothetical protein
MENRATAWGKEAERAVAWHAKGRSCWLAALLCRQKRMRWSFEFFMSTDREKGGGTMLCVFFFFCLLLPVYTHNSIKK